MTPSPSVVAASLSEAQRHDLLHAGCGVPKDNEEWTPDCICNAATLAELCNLGLAYHRIRFPGGTILTPLGLAVRALLERGE
jgi:hypothetical protein